MAVAGHGNRFVDICKQAREQVTESTVTDVKAKQDAGDAFHLVDVREESEFAKSKLPGSIHLGKGVIERDIEKTIPETNAVIYLYCGGGYRSALAALNLKQMGYTNVVSIDGGYKGWVAAGFPIDEGA